MIRVLIIISLFILGNCGGPTEPKIQLPTVQNIQFSIEEDSSKTFAFMGTDPSNRALTYLISSPPQNGTLTINGGAGTYTPNANFYGADVFAYVATNVDGTSNIGTIVATITPVDDEPNSMDINTTTNEDISVDITLEAEEYDGDNIIFQLRNPASNGSVTINGNIATYIPNENWNGTDVFNFEAIDYNDRKVLNTATAQITVLPVNDPPEILSDKSISVARFVESEINLTDLVTDIDSDNFTFTIVSNPSNGTISSNGYEVFYEPNIYSGTDSFTFTANDGEYDSNVGTVNIDIGKFLKSWINGSPYAGQDIPTKIFGDGNYGFHIFGRTFENSGGSALFLHVGPDGSEISHREIESGDYRNIQGVNEDYLAVGQYRDSSQDKYNYYALLFEEGPNAESWIQEWGDNSKHQVLYTPYRVSGGNYHVLGVDYNGTGSDDDVPVFFELDYQDGSIVNSFNFEYEGYNFYRAFKGVGDYDFILSNFTDSFSYGVTIENNAISSIELFDTSVVGDIILHSNGYFALTSTISGIEIVNINFQGEITYRTSPDISELEICTNGWNGECTLATLHVGTSSEGYLAVFSGRVNFTDSNGNANYYYQAYTAGFNSSGFFDVRKLNDFDSSGISFAPTDVQWAYVETGVEGYAITGFVDYINYEDGSQSPNAHIGIATVYSNGERTNQF